MKVKLLLTCMLIVSLIVMGSTFVLAQETPAKDAKADDPPKIDVNSATLEELQTIKGIGPKLAQAIIDARPYKEIQDLLEVKGIGEKTLKKFEEFIEVKPIEGEEKEGQAAEEPEKKEAEKKSEKKK